ncbi:hypothetical protein JCM5353_004641 [Sporobolomyces roseus]
MPLFGKSSSSSHTLSKPTTSAPSPYPPAHQLTTNQQSHSQPLQQHYQSAPPTPQQHNMSYGQPQQQGGGYPPVGTQGGGYPQQGGNSQLRAWFDAVDLDRSGHITLIELKQALVNGDWQPFDDQTILMLMRIFDVDGNGTITYGEFEGLWNYVKEWQGVFRQFDRDRSGTIEPQELSNALSTFGYNLSTQLIQMLQSKYNPPTQVQKPTSGYSGMRAPARPQGITFDRFVRCCVTIRQLSESFKEVDQDRDGWVNISYETFMTLVLAAP